MTSSTVATNTKSKDFGYSADSSDWHPLSGDKPEDDKPGLKNKDKFLVSSKESGSGHCQQEVITHTISVNQDGPRGDGGQLTPRARFNFDDAFLGDEKIKRANKNNNTNFTDAKVYSPVIVKENPSMDGAPVVNIKGAINIGRTSINSGAGDVKKINKNPGASDTKKEARTKPVKDASAKTAKKKPSGFDGNPPALEKLGKVTRLLLDRSDNIVGNAKDPAAFKTDCQTFETYKKNINNNLEEIRKNLESAENGLRGNTVMVIMAGFSTKALKDLKDLKEGYSSAMISLEQAAHSINTFGTVKNDVTQNPFEKLNAARDEIKVFRDKVKVQAAQRAPFKWPFSWEGPQKSLFAGLGFISPVVSMIGALGVVVSVAFGIVVPFIGATLTLVALFIWLHEKRKLQEVAVMNNIADAMKGIETMIGENIILNDLVQRTAREIVQQKKIENMEIQFKKLAEEVTRNKTPGIEVKNQIDALKASAVETQDGLVSLNVAANGSNRVYEDTIGEQRKLLDEQNKKIEEQGGEIEELKKNKDEFKNIIKSQEERMKSLESALAKLINAQNDEQLKNSSNEVAFDETTPGWDGAASQITPGSSSDSAGNSPSLISMPSGVTALGVGSSS